MSDERECVYIRLAVSRNDDSPMSEEDMDKVLDSTIEAIEARDFFAGGGASFESDSGVIVDLRSENARLHNIRRQHVAEIERLSMLVKEDNE